MNKLQQFNTALDNGFPKGVFDHLRNFLMASFLLAVGTDQFRDHTRLLFDVVPIKYTGLAVMVFAIMLILLNLYDGIRKISKSKYHLALSLGLIVIYIFLSLRIVVMAWTFRI
ncbi:MAG: hypothetical protein HRU05_02755 [Oceanospirillaceae bacterium]|nr:hypothetical protein [Oceanospirillaceae bacterium]